MEKKRVRSRRTVAEEEWAPGHFASPLVDREAYSVKLERIPPGGTSNPHTHRHSCQFFFILEGKARMYLGEEIYTLGVQEGIEVVPGRSHRIEHAGGEELVFLLISAPRVASDDIWPT